MNDIVLEPGKFYRINFADGPPIDFKVRQKDADTDAVLCEKKGGETFFLDTMEPWEGISEIESW